MGAGSEREEALEIAGIDLQFRVNTAKISVATRPAAAAIIYRRRLPPGPAIH
jgi:hypothetical protein